MTSNDERATRRDDATHAQRFDTRRANVQHTHDNNKHVVIACDVDDDDACDFHDDARAIVNTHCHDNTNTRVALCDTCVHDTLNDDDDAMCNTCRVALRTLYDMREHIERRDDNTTSITITTRDTRRTTYEHDALPNHEHTTYDVYVARNVDDMHERIINTTRQQRVDAYVMSCDIIDNNTSLTFTLIDDATIDTCVMCDTCKRVERFESSSLIDDVDDNDNDIIDDVRTRRAIAIARNEHACNDDAS